MKKAATRAISLRSKCSDRAAAACATRFAALLKAEPFPPVDSEHNVPSWRSLLWARALDGEASSRPAKITRGAKLAFKTWSTERLEQFRFDDATIALMRRLQTAGYKIGVLTNGHKEVQRAKTIACKAASLFGETRVIVAGEYPEQKPHASIFRVACEALGEQPANVIMVGDSYAADITGGINAGLLATVWVGPPPASDESDGRDGKDSGGSIMHGHVSTVPAGHPPPTHTLGSVLELESALEMIG